MAGGAALRGRAAKAVIAAALAMTICATLFNFYAAVVLLSSGTVPVLSGLAVAFGGYIAMSQGRGLMVGGS